MKPITYFSEHPQEWASSLDGADTLEKLKLLCEEWKELAPDALRTVVKMTGADFLQWRAGLKMERKGKFAGDSFSEKYGDITMPAIMFKVEMVASGYKVPWGLAYIRMKETGTLPTDKETP